MSTLTRTTHSPPSLPSFAQTFSNITATNGNSKSHHQMPREDDRHRERDILPPIRDLKGKKRSLDDEQRASPSASSSIGAPLLVKRETSASPSPDHSPPRTKKRRVGNDRDGGLAEPDEITRHKQKLAESRRGSAAGLVPPQSQQPSSSQSSAPPRPSPPVPRASNSNPNANPNTGHASTGSPPQQQHHFSLPFPPSSFSSRRRPLTSTSSAFPSSPVLPSSSSQAPNPNSNTNPTQTVTVRPKPLTIAPHTRRIEPLVHSAPVNGGFNFNGSSMRIPEVPNVPITPGRRGFERIVPIAKRGSRGLGLGVVPPTPAFHNTVHGHSASSSVAMPVPSTLSTPPQGLSQTQTQNQTQGQDPKSSFLTMFESFYDALNDSKLLKKWLGEQLTRSGTLIEALESKALLAGSSSMSGITSREMEELLERKMGPLKNEVEGLRRRVGELEEMLYKEREKSRSTYDGGAVAPRGGQGYDPISGSRGQPHDSAMDSSRPPHDPMAIARVPYDREREREKERDRQHSQSPHHYSPHIPHRQQLQSQAHPSQSQSHASTSQLHHPSSPQHYPPTSTASSAAPSPSFDQRRLSTSAVRLEATDVRERGDQRGAGETAHRRSPLGSGTGSGAGTGRKKAPSA
ncbi:hypothetical protein BU17DRAFT_95880 [Hysterangium stoloniferum]|nr:hypothetical protein BU17DRAFT_95880 [Hysterangium stoloniferum]